MVLNRKQYITSTKRLADKIQDLTIIIPIAGLNTRFNQNGPKSLTKISKTDTILSRQINLYKKYLPNADILLVIGKDSQKIIDEYHGQIKFIQNDLFESTNVVKSIGLALNATLSKAILISYGDLVFTENLFSYITCQDKSWMLLDYSNTFCQEEIGVSLQDNQVVNFSYQMPNKWAQIIYLTENYIIKLKEYTNDINHANHFGYEAISYIIDALGGIDAIGNDKIKILDVDQPRDINKAIEILK